MSLEAQAVGYTARLIGGLILLGVALIGVLEWNKSDKVLVALMLIVSQWAVFSAGTGFQLIFGEAS